MYMGCWEYVSFLANCMTDALELLTPSLQLLQIEVRTKVMTSTDQAGNIDRSIILLKLSESSL